MAASTPVAVRNRANQPGFLFTSTRQIRFEKNVRFFVGGRQSFWEGAAIVFRHAVFPFEEVSDALWFHPDFDTAQAGEQQIHFVAEAGGAAEILGGRMRGVDFILAQFEQSPACGKFIAANQSSRT